MRNLIFGRFSTNNTQRGLIRLIRVRKSNDSMEFALDSNAYRYALMLTTIDGTTPMGNWWRKQLYKVEECRLTDVVASGLRWRTDIENIRGVHKEFLFRIKRPSWALTISNRTYEYGLGSVWANAGELVTDNQYLNSFAQQEKVEFIELE
jgi:hypothetical protein